MVLSLLAACILKAEHACADMKVFELQLFRLTLQGHCSKWHLAPDRSEEQVDAITMPS